jgi:hypothetical protein
MRLGGGQCEVSEHAGHPSRLGGGYNLVVGCMLCIDGRSLCLVGCVCDGNAKAGK